MPNKDPEKRRAANRRWVEAHPEKKSASVRRWRIKRWAHNLLRDAVKASKVRGHAPPTITESDILAMFEASSVCPETRVQMVVSDHPRDPRRPSLDRIDNALGYTLENVRLTSLFWNMMRGDLPIEEARQTWAAWVEAWRKSTNTT